MKPIALVGALVLFLAGVSHAEEVIHVVGSTSFCAATITAVEDLLGAGGAYSVAYKHPQPSVDHDELSASSVILRGTISGKQVTVKCSWTGSIGGVLAVTKQLDISQIPGADGWILQSNIGSTASITIGNKTLNAVPAPSYGTDANGTYSTNETLTADVTMSDVMQFSTPYTTPVLLGGKVGVVVYEVVLNNGASTAVTNITKQQIAAILSVGIPLSQLSGNPTDILPVYCIGRNVASGARLSMLAELGSNINFGTQQVAEATTSGTIGGGNGLITQLGLYHAESLFPSPYTQSFVVGQSGYPSGGQVADILATPGSSSATDVADVSRQLLFGAPSWLIGYLSRNDANRAVKKTSMNTAHRLTFNGVQDWTGAADSQVTSYADNVVTEGLYSAWEYESFLYRSGLNSNQSSIVSALQTEVAADAGISGIPLNSMNVSKPVEGGLITHL